jgi:hypothetical protein
MRRVISQIGQILTIAGIARQIQLPAYVLKGAGNPSDQSSHGCASLVNGADTPRHIHFPARMDIWFRSAQATKRNLELKRGDLRGRAPFDSRRMNSAMLAATCFGDGAFPGASLDASDQLFARDRGEHDQKRN